MHPILEEHGELIAAILLTLLAVILIYYIRSFK